MSGTNVLCHCNEGVTYKVGTVVRVGNASDLFAEIVRMTSYANGDGSDWVSYTVLTFEDEPEFLDLPYDYVSKVVVEPSPSIVRLQRM
jgi:hypothetical protein